MMKKLLSLMTGLLIFVGQLAFAQCVPDPQYTQPGFYPDTATGLPIAENGVLYDEDINLVVPADTVIVFAFPVDSAVLTSLTGLPPGIGFTCGGTLNNSTYSWGGGDAGCINLTGVPTTNGTYNILAVVETYIAGMTEPQSTENIDYYSITVAYIPFILSFTVSNNLFTAPPFAVQFDNTTPNPSNYNFTWDFGDGTIIANNNLLLFHEYLFNGTYDITLFAEKISSGSMDTLYQDDYIYCTGGTGCTHSANITQTGPVNSSIGDSVFLSCNTNPTFTYQWKHNGVTILGATNSFYYAKQSGSYTVMIIKDNCPEHSQGIDVYFNVVGIAEQPPNKLTLYPNPTTGILTIEGAEGKVSVYDIYGRLVLTSNSNTLDISQAATGIYFVRVLDEQGKVYSQKVVKD